MAIKQEIEKKTKRTCLYDKHVSLGAMMVEFGGFDMPLLYQNAGIAPEHTAVREHVGLFDVSHMGEVTVKGKDAVGLQDGRERLFPRHQCRQYRQRLGMDAGACARLRHRPAES